MDGHPIEGLMKTTMESIKDMVDVNTIVGDAVETPDGTVIIPISKVGFGFASGGGEYDQKSEKNQSDSSEDEFPFAGGAGAGVSIQPVAFMVVGQGQIRLLPVDQNTIVERIIDLTPQLINEIKNMMNKKDNNIQNPNNM
ncbi:GerW family sporulation protein [Garciella nitratireducens]|uniref:Sporulation protein YtfJ n=1 Tax=Garciella nitratireducens DSM 15102 TaxID=1121911 RepID=A0A1T4JUN4_9FIRM|nr:GerW family sporulation protein [Garciella nitratireducens]RBP45582.1 sporulation protein YtfJ [Garciella nitratireducens]SJZ33848.1 sporulation protein YtfJ [Garciella nitratireducens DSM 15102]